MGTMTQRERDREVRRRLYRYWAYRRDIDDYEQLIFGKPQMDESGIRSPGISDPTARIGMALACPPPLINEKYQWVAAIEDALAEMDETDYGDLKPLSYIAAKVYGLDGKRHKRRQNRDTAIRTALDCGLSRTTLYNRLDVIRSIVQYHAVKRNLL